MRFDYQNPELEAPLTAARTTQELEAALQKIAAFITPLLGSDSLGQTLFWPAMDAAVADLPRRLNLPDAPLPKGQGNVVVLATRFYATGGHSRVAADISRLAGGDNVTIIVPDVYRALTQVNMVPKPGAPDAMFHRRATVLLSAPTLVEKICELYMILAAIRPSRIFLMHNHMDAVAVAAAWPFRSVVDFVHHADFMPAIGASLRFSSHVDLTYSCHLACREAGREPVFAGMATAAPPAETPAPRRPGPLRIATCGAMRKYQNAAGAQWSDYAVAALSATDAEIIHIGPFDDAFVADIHGALAAVGIAAERYQFVGAVADLRAELLDRGADLYLASYPESGSRANLEALSAGLPLMVPVEPGQRLLLEDRWPFAEATKVRTPDELRALLADGGAGLIEAARDPGNQSRLLEQSRRFEAWVSGEALAPVRPDDRLPA